MIYDEERNGDDGFRAMQNTTNLYSIWTEVGAVINLIAVNIGLGLIFNRITQIEFYFLYFITLYKTSKFTGYT